MTAGALLSIGEFSKMTYLTVKALRYYHDIGLLEPVEVDAYTGYRRYAPSQAATAQAIRRFRDLEMPIDEVRKVLEAHDPVERNQAVLTHLERLQQQLERTQLSVSSLQDLLCGEHRAERPIRLERLPVTRVLSIESAVPFDECPSWLDGALAGLHRLIDAGKMSVSGAEGALYADEFFQLGVGRVTAFVPVIGDGPQTRDLPALTVAVLDHDGPVADLDRTYSELGTAVAERGIGGPGPIREQYLTPSLTQVCWPIMTAEDSGHVVSFRP